ncbi:MAG: phage tail protein [Pseudomonadota bacterium]
MRFFKTLAIAGLLSLALMPAQAADLWRSEGQPTFVDSNGDPYAAAKLCYFDAETTNERTVYQDAAETTPWSQPITLNAAGALDNPIYVKTGAFKEVFLSSDATDCSSGSTLFTSDNIPGALDVNALGIDFAKPDRPVIAAAASFTVGTASLGQVFNVDATGGAVTATLPSAITAGDGAILTFRKVDGSANAVTVATVGAQTIDGAATYSLSDQYDSISIIGDGANWHTYDAVVPSSITFADLDSGMVSSDTTLAGSSTTEVPTENAVKVYVDTVFSSGVAWLDPVAAASTANVTLASDVENGDTLDGVTLSTNDRILLKDQSSASENGVYIVAASGAPSRATDIDQAAEFSGATVFVSAGTTNEGDTYTQTQTVATVDTDDVLWSLISSGVAYTADEVTLTRSGNQFSIKDGGVDADAIATGAVGADEIAAASIPKADLVAAVQEALVPTGTVAAYAGTSAPAGWLFAFGQCVSDTTYADLDTVLGSTWDTANGCSAGEVGVPDLRGRVIAGQDDMGGVSANRLLGTDTDGVGVDGDTFGATGGEELTTDVASHLHGDGSLAFSDSFTTSTDTHSHEPDDPNRNFITTGVLDSVQNGGGANTWISQEVRTDDDPHNHSGSVSGAVTGSTASTGDASVTNMQPTMILNYIIKH